MAPSLDTMPMEIMDKIASELDSLEELGALAQACTQAGYVIISPQASCWRIIFKRNWDLPSGKTRYALIQRFYERTAFNWRGVAFGLGDGYAGPCMNRCENEAKLLNIARDLIVESYAGMTTSATENQESRNQEQLQLLVQNTNLGDCNKYWHPIDNPPTRLIQAVWLSTLQWHLQDSSQRVRTLSPSYHFLHSQRAVYQHPGTTGIFVNRQCFEVNLMLAVNVANFFKFYLTKRHGFQMHDRFQALLNTALEKPQPWRQQILQGSQRLGTTWKSVNAYLPSWKVSKLRANRDREKIMADELDEEFGFAELNLDFDTSYRISQDYEDAMESIPPVSLIDALKDYATDWIKNAHDPGEFSNATSDSALKREGETKMEMLLSWKTFSTRYPPSKDDYAAAKRKFCESWREFILTPPVSPSVPGFSSQTSAYLMAPPDYKYTRAKKGKKAPPPPPPTKATAGVDYHTFSGSGVDGPRAFNCVGNVHAVLPVEGIPGWQRISMMKCYNGDPNLEFCYEGVVFPGNMIMVGRWWKKRDGPLRYNCGPFMYWRSG